MGYIRQVSFDVTDVYRAYKSIASEFARGVKNPRHPDNLRLFEIIKAEVDVLKLLVSPSGVRDGKVNAGISAQEFYQRVNVQLVEAASDDEVRKGLEIIVAVSGIEGFKGPAFTKA